MKGKILCPAGCQNRRSRITKAKEILKNLLSAGSWRPLKCIFSEKGKRPPTAGRKPCPVRSMYGKTRKGQVCGSYRASLRQLQSKFLPRCQNPQFCGFAPRGKLVGECLPQTLLWRLAPQKYFRPAGHFFARTAPEIPNRPAYFL